jgi:hypothetical protein
MNDLVFRHFECPAPRSSLHVLSYQPDFLTNFELGHWLRSRVASGPGREDEEDDKNLSPRIGPWPGARVNWKNRSASCRNNWCAENQSRS